VTVSLTLNEYQDLALATAVYPGQGTIYGLMYAGLGLGEAGEVQNKIKKVLRDDDSVVTTLATAAIAKELGGNLWYIAACAKELGMTLAQIGAINLQELAGRRERGTIHGSGDNR
jgi:NTP pyrophosphatase (non-canonical NTP hydrolase)